MMSLACVIKFQNAYKINKTIMWSTDQNVQVQLHNKILPATIAVIASFTFLEKYFVPSLVIISVLTMQI